MLADAGLFFLHEFTDAAQEIYERRKSELSERARDLRERRKKILKGSEVGARAVNLAFILERLAPAIQGFGFERNDCRSLFDPIDYVIFDGLSRRGAVDCILFVDIKTGKARLQQKQKEIRNLVEAGKGKMDVYRTEVGR